LWNLRPKTSETLRTWQEHYVSGCTHDDQAYWITDE
jgi:hypothetical protein